MANSRGPYGLWSSPVTPAGQAQARRLADLAWDTDGRTLAWVEGRSSFGMLLAAEPGQAARELTPELSVRARVGYGGGDMTVGQGRVVFSSGGRLHAQSLAAGQAAAITPPYGDAASPAISPDGRWVIYVHSDGVHDCLAIVDIDGRFWPQRLHWCDDFCMQPVWHTDGRRIAWVSWRHPQMPWDGAFLNVATVNDGGDALPRLTHHAVVAGDTQTAILQPAFSPDGRYLSYASDASGWFGIHLYDLECGESHPLVGEAAEWGLAAWVQGTRVHVWAPDSEWIYACRTQQARTTLWRIEAMTGRRDLVSLGGDYTDVQQPCVSADGALAAIVSGPAIPPRIVVHRAATDFSVCVARSRSEIIPAEHFSVPQHVEWRSQEGDPVYGIYYPPAGGEQRADELPPLIVTVHGGPTGMAGRGFSGQAQFFATRGYAVLDVNYRGSTGYGRRYRDMLKGRWGITDADDAVSGARAMAEGHLADGQRMAMMGGSAGGFTVLQTLIHYPHVFKAGLCLYGVTNLFTLAADTHKFERHYLDALVGSLPAEASLYRERSPLFHAEGIVDPIAVFQGDEDRVVPREQAETIVSALRRTGVPHEYHVYAGEGHGWRKSETVAAFYEAVVRFLRQYVLFA